MAKYYRTNLTGADASTPNYPPIAPLCGGELAARSRAESILRAQDKFPALGRRIVLTQSLEDNFFLVPNTNPTIPGNSTPPTRTHPPPNLPRLVGAGRFDLTPGCFLRLSALVYPSGATQDQVTYISVSTLHRYDPAVNQGRIRLVITWYDATGDDIQTTHDFDLPTSNLQFGAYATDEDAWRYPRLVHSGLIRPGDLDDDDFLNLVSRHTHCWVEMYHIGGVRSIDTVLYEEPAALAMEADDPAGDWVSHTYTLDTEQGAPQFLYPWQTINPSADGDPRGSARMLDVHHGAWDRFGPALINWVAYSESNTNGTIGINTDDTTYTQAYMFVNNTSFGRVPDGAITSYSSTAPGWSIAAGAYSRRLAENHPSVMGNNGSIPVIVRVRAGTASAGTTGVFRLQSSPYSIMEMTMSNLQTTPAWYSGYGHLRCGTGPGDESIVQAFTRRNGAGGSVRIYQFSVHRAGSWTPRGGS